MTADIINIGDELLIGDTINTNAAWMASELDKVGIMVQSVQVIGDDEKAILKSLEYSMKNTDLILITGGLGPTHDDITKHTLAEFFDDELIISEEVMGDVEALLKSFGKEMNDLNRTQAYIPSKCEVIRNKRGTAPGMLFNIDGKILVSMPGVPHEMRSIMRNVVLPRLTNNLKSSHRKHAYLRVFGIAEASLAERLAPILNTMPSNVKLAFLPSPGHVKLRLSCVGSDEIAVAELLEVQKSRFKKALGLEIYGEEIDTLENVIGRLLNEQKLTVSTAESCTGGKLASKITSVPGSSAYYQGSIIAYSNEVKINELQVSGSDLEKHGAVSREVVEAMAKGVRIRFKTDVGLATSGIAGPDGGTDEKPVGTIWIALSVLNTTLSAELKLGFNRQMNIELTSDHVLNLLRKELMKKS